MTTTENLTPISENNHNYEFLNSSDFIIIDQLQILKDQLCDYYKEREDIIYTMFLCLLSDQHQLQIGPPGTAKSALINSFTSSIEGYKMFKYQLNKYTTPEELYGSFDLNELKKGNYVRKSEGKLQKAQIVFLDEVFNGNSSILNKNNEIMNERTFENEKANLVCLFGATNFEPEDTVLVALFDRFLFRHYIDYIKNANLFAEMLKLNEFNSNIKINAQKIKELKEKVFLIKVPDRIIDLITEIRENLKKEGIIPSDRRFKWALHAIKAAALFEKREYILPEDLLLLQDVLWDDKKHKLVVERKIKKIVLPIMDKIQLLLDEAKEIIDTALNTDLNKTTIILECLDKLSLIKKDIISITEKSKDLSEKTKKIIEKIIEKIEEEKSHIYNEKINPITKYSQYLNT